MQTRNLDETNSAQSPTNAALYIGALSIELAELARHNGFECLGYILDMARLEAEQIARGVADPNGSA
jgi:hypothetical protein